MNLQNDDLEEIRTKMSSATALQEALDQCLHQVSVESMDTLAHSLSGLIKRGIGLTTRTGVAKFVDSLCVHKPTIVSTKAGKHLGGG